MIKLWWKIRWLVVLKVMDENKTAKSASADAIHEAEARLEAVRAEQKEASVLKTQHQNK